MYLFRASKANSGKDAGFCNHGLPSAPEVSPDIVGRALTLAHARSLTTAIVSHVRIRLELLISPTNMYFIVSSFSDAFNLQHSNHQNYQTSPSSDAPELGHREDLPRSSQTTATGPAAAWSTAARSL